MEHYSAARRMKFCHLQEHGWSCNNSMEGIMLSEISQRKTNFVCYHLHVESRKIKLMNIAKKKQTHRYRKQTSGYQWGEGSWEGQDRGWGLRGKNYHVKSK